LILIGYGDKVYGEFSISYLTYAIRENEMVSTIEEEESK